METVAPEEYSTKTQNVWLVNERMNGCFSAPYLRSCIETVPNLQQDWQTNRWEGSPLC